MKRQKSSSSEVSGCAQSQWIKLFFTWWLAAFPAQVVSHKNVYYFLLAQIYRPNSLNSKCECICRSLTLLLTLLLSLSQSRINSAVPKQHQHQQNKNKRCDAPGSFHRIKSIYGDIRANMFTLSKCQVKMDLSAAASHIENWLLDVRSFSRKSHVASLDVLRCTPHHNKLPHVHHIVHGHVLAVKRINHENIFSFAFWTLYVNIVHRTHAMTDSSIQSQSHTK